MTNRLNVAANVATIITCLLLSAVLYQQLRSGARPVPSPPQTYNEGEKIEGFPELDSEQPVVVLYLSSQCRFCDQSMTFYKRLTDVREQRGFKVIALARESESALTAYLSKHSVSVDGVVSIASRPMKLSATPTLLVLDPGPTVSKAWVGLLGEREREVNERLGVSTN